MSSQVDIAGVQFPEALIANCRELPDMIEMSPAHPDTANRILELFGIKVNEDVCKDSFSLATFIRSRLPVVINKGEIANMEKTLEFCTALLKAIEKGTLTFKEGEGFILPVNMALISNRSSQFEALITLETEMFAPVAPEVVLHGVKQNAVEACMGTDVTPARIEGVFDPFIKNKLINQDLCKTHDLYFQDYPKIKDVRKVGDSTPEDKYNDREIVIPSLDEAIILWKRATGYDMGTFVDIENITTLAALKDYADTAAIKHNVLKKILEA